MREFMIGAASAVLAFTIIIITREASKRPAYRQES